MYFVYVLKSKKITEKYYIGHSEDLKERLKRHNNGYVRSTKHARPWKIIHVEEYENKNNAYRRELEIKSYKGGSAFKKLIGI